MDRIWVHLSDRADLDTRALLSQKSDGACDRVAVREALGQQSARYRTFATAEEAGATLPVVIGTGLTEEALFPVEDCD
ncbi:MAG: hypothetical protein IPI35_29790 [Deltaproteobacteria bacterium]|nr:hypothetical protein [Deltaproteobacteria bacterium]